jgi:hypothetical protein
MLHAFHAVYVVPAFSFHDRKPEAETKFYYSFLREL